MLFFIYLYYNFVKLQLFQHFRNGTNSIQMTNYGDGPGTDKKGNFSLAKEVEEKIKRLIKLLSKVVIILNYICTKTT